MASSRSCRELRLFSRTLPPPRDISVLRERLGRIPGSVILESAAASTPWGRYSIFAANPIRVVESPCLNPPDPFLQLGSAIEYPFYGGAELPFPGGWIGYVGYEAARFTEPASGVSDIHEQVPLSRWGLYDAFLLHDHETGKWSLVSCDLPADLFQDGAKTSVEERCEELESIAVSGESGSRRERETHELAGEWNYSRSAYLAKVRRALEYIRAGDIYQVNLARRFRAAGRFDAALLYQRLCECNPSPYAALLNLGSSAIVSSSPELFLRVRGRDVTTRPIKGTRPRGTHAGRDEMAVRALAASAKDRAELNMIIDLERNDLGRVCEFGSVKVVSEGEIEKCPTVFHRTATVEGRLREDVGVVDILRACFPGGSITGAPKVRAMQIINELEPDPRGPYCGAIGYIGLNGCMQLNLAIRTLIRHSSGVDLFVGSGIVADSDPEEEFEELAAKAAGMLQALRESDGSIAGNVEREVTAHA